MIEERNKKEIFETLAFLNNFRFALIEEVIKKRLNFFRYWEEYVGCNAENKFTTREIIIIMMKINFDKSYNNISIQGVFCRIFILNFENKLASTHANLKLKSQTQLFEMPFYLQIPLWMSFFPRLLFQYYSYCCNFPLVTSIIFKETCMYVYKFLLCGIYIYFCCFQIELLDLTLNQYLLLIQAPILPFVENLVLLVVKVILFFTYKKVSN